MEKKRALISVYDKEGIIEFASALIESGYEIISSQNTHKFLIENKIDSVQIEDITKFPEILDGRVKTLHPKIHGGILAKRDNKKHIQTLKENDINFIDIVCVNLYPFSKVLEKKAEEEEELIENIDIGGPALIRSAAKNFNSVLVITDKLDYNNIINELKTGVLPKTRRNMMAKAFQYTAEYDSIIASHFGGDFPDKLILSFKKNQDLRYGENPHQSAAYYIESNKELDFEKLNGRELSFNNINDLYAALDLLSEFGEPCCVAVKHTTPCGVGKGGNILDAFQKAYKTDPISIFGGIVAVNKEIDLEAAEEMSKIFLELIIAPSFSEEAFEILSRKKNIRLLKLKEKIKPRFDYKKTFNGILIQEYDSIMLNSNLEHITEAKPTHKQIFDMLFANKIAKHLKSNSIAIVSNGQAIGLGGGQTSRIDALKKTISNAIDNFGKEALQNAVMASDAFFPFDDCIELANSVGIKAIIQPGGSKNDIDSINACNKYNISMSFTQTRHFKH